MRRDLLPEQSIVGLLQLVGHDDLPLDGQGQGHQGGVDDLQQVVEADSLLPQDGHQGVVA